MTRHLSTNSLLLDVWKASCLPDNEMEIADRLALCKGICVVFLSLPAERQAGAFDSFVSCLLDSFETMVVALRVSERSHTFDSGLSKLSTVISVMASLPRMLATAGNMSNDVMQSGCDTSPDEHSNLAEIITGTLRRAWSNLSIVCENYVHNDVSSNSWEVYSLYRSFHSRTPWTECIQVYM